MSANALTLLIPLDNTPFSERIFPVLERLFPPGRTRLKLLHIAGTPDRMDDTLMTPAMVGVDYGFYLYSDPRLVHPLHSDEDMSAYREELRDVLERQVERARQLGYEAEATVLFGRPVEEIRAFANESGVDAVAMTTHARSGFDRFLLGSVAQDLIQHITLPVLLVPIEEG